MSVQLADQSVKYHKDIIEDLLVQVDNLIIYVDFVVMDMDNDLVKFNESVILLGRPFMATRRTVIDVHNGRLSMTVLGQTVQFEVFQVNNVHVDKMDECLLIDEFVGCFDECNVNVLGKSQNHLHAFSDIDIDLINEQWFDDLLGLTEDDPYVTNNV